MLNVFLYKLIRKSRRSSAVVKGSFFMLFSSAISALTKLGLVLVLVRYYSKEEFGLWSAITATAAIIATGDFGIINALRNKISQLIVIGEEGMKEAQSYFYSSVIFFFFVSLLLSGILYILSHYIPFDILFKTDNEYLKTQGVSIILWVQFLFFLNIPLGVGGALFFSFQESHYNALFATIQSVFSFLLVIVLSLVNASIVTVSIAYFISNVLISLLGTVFFVMKRKWFTYRFDFKIFFLQIKELFFTGIKFMGLQLSNSFLQNAATIATSSFLNVSIAGEFSMVTKLYTFAVGIYQSIFNPIWGGYAEAVARKDWKWCRKTLYITVTSTFIIFFIFSILVMVFGNYAIGLLAGEEYLTTPYLLFLLGMVSLSFMVFSSSSILLYSINRLNLLLLSMLLFVAVIMPLNKYAVYRYGLEGIAYVSIFSWIILFFIAFYLSQRVILKMRMKSSDIN